MISNILENFGSFIGLDGTIVLAFILGLPANEIILPIILMIYTNSQALTNYTNLIDLNNILMQNNWTITTAICFIILLICHYPCGTTIATIKKETNSIKWTILAIILPTLVGLILCITTKTTFNIIT